MNVVPSILLRPRPYFLRSGLLWHGLTLRLADWLSSPLANDSRLQPLLPCTFLTADNTSSSTRHRQKIPPCLLVQPVSNGHVIYCPCKCIGSEQGAATCKIASLPVVSFQIQKCCLIQAYKVWINTVVVGFFLKKVVGVSRLGLIICQVAWSRQKTVDGAWES